jgi:hypothetical protein
MLIAVLILALAGTPQLHAVTGIVLDPDALPVPHALVHIDCNDWSVATETAADGRFSVQAPDASCSVTVTAAGFAPATAALPADSGARLVMRLRVQEVREELAVQASDSLASLTLDRDAMRGIGPDAESVLQYALARIGLTTRPVAIYVDGLPAPVLPSLDMVESLHVNGSPFSAEYGDGDVVRVDIVPRAVSRRWSLRPNGSVLAFGGGDRLAAGSTAMSRSANVGFGGPIPRFPLSFSGEVTRSVSARDLALLAPMSPASLADTGDRDGRPTASSETTTASLGVSYSARAGSRMFVAGSQTLAHSTNVGAGGLVLPSAGLEARTTSRAAQASISAVRARFISESGVVVRSSSMDTTANSIDRGMSVPGVFVSGGAPVSAQDTGRTTWSARQVVRLSTRLPVSAGAMVTGSRQHVAVVPNPLGTLVFDSVDALQAGLPAASRIQARAPASYGVVDRVVSAFVQADFLRRSTLDVNGGIRFDSQTRTPLAVSPRIAATKQYGALTLNAGAGLFSIPVFSSVFLAEQASAAGAMPYVGQVSPAAVTGVAEGSPVRTVIAADIHQARQFLTRISAERPIGGVNVGLEYGWSRDTGRVGASRLRDDAGWVDLISPVQEARRHTLVSRVRYRWRGFSTTGSYVYVRARDTGDGASFYSQFADANEWAPTAGVPSHAAVVTASAVLPGGWSLSAVAAWQGRAPVDVSTGRDDNGDGLFIERGTAGRNSGVVPSQQTSSVHLSRTVTVGRTSRWRGVRVGVGAHIDNLLNARNPITVGTVIGSSTFGQPLSAMPGRTIRFTATVY